LSKIYEIGPFRLDCDAGLLSQAGVPVALGSRAVAVLTALVDRANDCVPKSVIMDTAWPGVVVEESNLAVQILSIRRVFATTPGGAHWVETLARRGYRFVGPLLDLADDRQGTRGSKRSNLPESLTSFIGRERELVEIKRLLASKRLLTLVGVGGIGKTRLALQVAAEVEDAYRDGVYLVEFGSISDSSLVTTSVARALDLQERAGKPLAETLIAHLKSRQMLLVLDNCEHLLGACATLADAVLRGAAQTTVIATSREPLHVQGEQTYPLQTLSLADPSASAEAIARSEAVQLFVERARRHLPDFTLSAARASAVAELCVHLDGIPLALELAAARVPSLSIEQISARLDDRFRLLTTGARTALPRQQTLRATLDWSHDLLAPDERAVLRRLAVFAGGFTLEEAASVASDREIDARAVTDLLSQLVERSLVAADTNDARSRYRLLETTRAYAMEKLVEAAEMKVISLRHAQHFRDRFERAPDDWLRMSTAEWQSAYVPELDNIRAALDWALGSDGDSAIGIALAGASGPLWSELSLLSEGRRRIEDAISLVSPQTPEPDQARLWLRMGLLWSTAAPARVVAALERAIELYRRLGNGSGLGISLVSLGRIWVFMGRFEDAAAVFAEALPLLQQAGVPKLRGRYFEGLGFLKMLSGDLATARQHFEEALTLYRVAGAESAALAMLLNLADMTWALVDLDAALADFREAAALMRKSRLAPKGMLGVCLTNLAGVHIERGELGEGLAIAREGLPLREFEGHGWVALDHLALRAALVGNVASAARLAGFTDATYEAKEAPRQPNESRAHGRLHRLLREELASDELQRLLAEGAKMGEAEAYRMALEE
jgi:predicted ATPase/DNA-binding winged helix-turn-helix (wHTH) protein